MSNKTTRQAYIEKAKERLANHEYTLLAKGEQAEVWSCKNKSGTNCYAFNISIAPMGISVVGDIGELTFGVYGRGLDFLAGDDVEYYIHSKLTANCREVEYNTEGIEEVVATAVKYTFENSNTIFELLREEELSKIQSDIAELNFYELKKYFFSIYTSLSGEEHDVFDFYDDLDTLLTDVSKLNDMREAYKLLNDCEIIAFDECMEYDFERDTKRLITNLYLINQAAINIIEQNSQKTKIALSEAEIAIIGLDDVVGAE